MGLGSYFSYHRWEEARTMSSPDAATGNDQTVSDGFEPTGASMHARVGDEIVVRGTTDGVVERDGEIVGLHHADGSPPYDVRWAESEKVTVYFPGPDAAVRHLPQIAQAASSGRRATSDSVSRGSDVRPR